LIEVARHPQVLVKLRQELDSVHSDWTVPFSFNDVSKLNYLQMVINESMSLRPVAAGQFRVAELEIEVEGGYVIPKGTDCLIYFMSMFRHGINVSRIH
jgi:cytochrome P450